jgi:hypothetical protein
MPTLYVDYESGNDNYGGTSFTLLASAADGALTTLGAFTSASASFPNDGSLIGQYLSIFNGTIYAVYRVTAWVSATALTVVALSGGTALSTLSARQYYIGGRWQTIDRGATAVRTIPGDNIRIKATSGPSLVGNALWTGGLKPTSKAITSSTNATPIVITSTAHGFVTGDYVLITSHATNTNALGVWKVGTTAANTFQILQLDGSNTTGNGVGSGGTAQQINKNIVKLASPANQNIALCGGLGQKPVWTAATANVTCTQNLTDYKEGYSAAQLAVNATFTTGKVAYYTLPATLDLSAYQQVAFWVKQSSGGSTIATPGYIALCTDTLGDVVAHTCTIPPLTNTNQWNPITVDLGVNLNSAILSVAFYITLDNNAQTMIFDNIIACKASSSADSLTLNSVLSKSDGTGIEAWYSAQFVNYDVMMISNSTAFAPTNPNNLGYTGTTETVSTYKSEPVKPLGTNNDVAQSIIPNESGTAGNLISYSGGWNRTDMSTQTGQTWLDGSNGSQSGVAPTARSYLGFDRMNVVRYAQGYNLLSSSTSFTIGTIYATGCGVGVNFNGTVTGTTFGNIWVSNNNSSFGGMNISSAKGVTIGNIYSLNNALGMNMGGADVTIESITVVNSNTAGIQTNGVFNWLIKTASITDCVGVPAMTFSGSTNFVIGGGSTSGNGSGITQGSTAYPTQAYLNNFTINEATEVSISASFIGQMYVYSNRHDNTDNNSWVFQGVGTVNQQTAVVDSPATTSWLMRPTSTSATTLNPLRLKLGTVVCAASSLVTVTARMRRDNTGLTMRLVCPGGQISGVSSNVTADMTALANTWETVTITFTPTKAGAVDIYAQAFGGTTLNGYVCNLTASQA